VRFPTRLELRRRRRHEAAGRQIASEHNNRERVLLQAFAAHKNLAPRLRRQPGLRRRREKIIAGLAELCGALVDLRQQARVKR